MHKKLIVKLIMSVLMVSIIITPISAAEIPEGLNSLNEKELSGIRGMGQNFSIEQINSSNVKFRYSSNKDNAFKHASGVMNITNVSGNENTINNVVDLKINIYNIEEVENLELSDIKNMVNLKN
ncbi:MAG TPA: hypothetical protein VJ907_01010 [Halanaerobiales bacterium]|nr:hypothetical protein [Halanaerobiales bacterium]